jgi:diguanylate cyclase (GGDEF)-like protein
MPNPVLDSLKTTGRLPSPSGVALHIMELCRQEDATVEKVAHAVQADPALTGRLIKFTNASMHGSRRPVASVADAIRLCGINTVRQLVLAFALVGQYSKGACKNFDYSLFWSRSLAVGIAANSLMSRVRASRPDEAFTCGLLSDIGRLALATIFPEEYSKFLGQAQRNEADLILAERHQFSTDHRELTAALMDDWRVPSVLVGAVHFHVTPDESRYTAGSREYQLTYVLNLAGKIGDYCTLDDNRRKVMSPGLLLVAAKLGIDRETLELLLDEIAAEWREWGKILHVQTRDVATLGLENVTLSAVPGTPAKERASERKRSAPVRVLVADDDPSMRVLIESLLVAEGHTVVTARDGKEALKLAIETSPHLIIADWIMPELDGTMLCRALRETEHGKRIYFLILTTMVSDDQLVQAFESGCDDYIVKPFNARVFMARVNAGLRVIDLQREQVRDGETLHKFAVELAVANRRLQQSALTDILTGLPNRRMVMERLEQEWAGSLRSQRPLSLIALDIDRFDQVNELFGHDGGDGTLRHVAQLIRKTVRTEDVVGRLDGDEFLVILPSTTSAVAAQMAERLRKAVSDEVVKRGDQRVNLSISLGVTARESRSTGPEDLLRHVEGLMAQAKMDGRNRISTDHDSKLASA